MSFNDELALRRETEVPASTDAGPPRGDAQGVDRQLTLLDATGRGTPEGELHNMAPTLGVDSETVAEDFHRDGVGRREDGRNRILFDECGSKADETDETDEMDKTNKTR